MDLVHLAASQPASEAADRLIATAAGVQKALTDLSLATGKLGERMAHVEGEVGKIAAARRIQVVQAKCEQAAQQTKETKADVQQVKDDVRETKVAVQDITDVPVKVPAWQFWKAIRLW